MNKIPVDISKEFCPYPMTLFIFGTYKEDKTENFGLFCWMNFCWDDGLKIMVCMDGEKTTKDILKKKKVFSANIVTEKLLPLADYLGHKKDSIKDSCSLVTSHGKVLDVPVLDESPINYELEVVNTISLSGSDIFICEIKNVMVDISVLDSNKNIDFSKIKPAITAMQNYFSLTQKGKWGDWK